MRLGAPTVVRLEGALHAWERTYLGPIGQMGQDHPQAYSPDLSGTTGLTSV